jgi:hypothetical protein
MIEKTVPPFEEINHVPLEEDMRIFIDEDRTAEVVEGDMVFYLRGIELFRIPEWMVGEVSWRIAQQRVLEFMKKQKIIKDEKEKAND